jgi:aerobic carbon-monoxide dehydrogenase medium subunit
VNSFTYVEPRDVGEVLETLARYGDEAKLIAGGTGLINLMKQNLVQPAYLVGLRRIRGLDSIKSASGLAIGALCTLRKIESSSAVVDSGFSLLAETCRQVATIRIRSMATIGGALAHADPYQDTPPALMALDAVVRLRSQKGTREVPVSDLFTGYYETVIQPDELVTEVLIPAQPSGGGSVFIKFLPQTHDDYATVAVAARVTLQDERISDARVALGAAASTPLRAKVVEDALRGQAPTPNILRDTSALVASVVDPISDFPRLGELQARYGGGVRAAGARAGSHASTGRKRVNFEQRCIIPAAREELWDFLLDLPQMARCVPGAEEVVAAGDGEYTGRLRVKIGPIQLALQGAMKILERDREHWKAVARVEAKDRRVGGGANITGNMTLLESGPLVTELIIQGQVRFLGKLGEFGEPIIRKQADAVDATFVRNVMAHFAGAAITQQAADAPQAAITSKASNGRIEATATEPPQSAPAVATPALAKTPKTPKTPLIGLMAGLVAGLLLASALPAASPAVTLTLRATVVLALMLIGAKTESHLRHSSDS